MQPCPWLPKSTRRHNNHNHLRNWSPRLTAFAVSTISIFPSPSWTTSTILLLKPCIIYSTIVHLWTDFFVKLKRAQVRKSLISLFFLILLTFVIIEVSIGEWEKNGSIPYSRESSYIKFLGGSIGPKSTKCYLKEDVLHLDTADYVSQLTVTQTPDVPAGGSFNVKTKTCISWSGQGQVRVLVTVLVDFTKSSWLKCKKKFTYDIKRNI